MVRFQRIGVLACLVMCVGLCLVLVTSRGPRLEAGGDQPVDLGKKRDALGGEEFAGKFLLLIANTKEPISTLQNVTVKKVGDKTFLFGSHIQKNRFSGSEYGSPTVWVNLDHVQKIFAFDKVEDVQQVRPSSVK